MVKSGELTLGLLQAAEARGGPSGASVRGVEHMELAVFWLAGTTDRSRELQSRVSPA